MSGLEHRPLSGPPDDITLAWFDPATGNGSGPTAPAPGSCRSLPVRSRHRKIAASAPAPSTGCVAGWAWVTAMNSFPPGIRKLLLVSPLLGSLLLAACAPLSPGPRAPVEEGPAIPAPPQPPAPAPRPVEPTPAPPPRPAPPPVAPDAVAALVAEARSAADAGHHDAAAALAERAQRIDPRAPSPTWCWPAPTKPAARPPRRASSPSRASPPAAPARRCAPSSRRCCGVWGSKVARQ